MSSSSGLSIQSNSEAGDMMDVDFRGRASCHPSDQGSASPPAGTSTQQSRVMTTTNALPQSQVQGVAGSELMTAAAQTAESISSKQSFSASRPGYRRTTSFNRTSQSMGHLGGYLNHYFDHWFHGEHPHEEDYMSIRDSRPAFLRTSPWALTDGERPWQEVQEQCFPHIVTDSTASIMGMHPGHYLSGLYNLDGQIRSSVYVNNMAMMAGLRLAIGRLSNIVHIPADVLVADLPASRWDLTDAHATNMETRRFTVIPVYFTNHWAIGILDQATSSFYFFDSMKDDRSRRASKAMKLIREILLQFGQVDWADNLQMRVMELPQQQRDWNCGLISLESVRVFFREHDLQRSDEERAVDEGLHPLVMLHTWTHSPAYQGQAWVETYQAETNMINLWLSAIQQELGLPTDIRSPSKPGIDFQATGDGSGTDILNSLRTNGQQLITIHPKDDRSTATSSQAPLTHFLFPCVQQGIVQSPELDQYPREQGMPIPSASLNDSGRLVGSVMGVSSISPVRENEGLHSHFTSEVCIEWEQARNVELCQRMRRIRMRLLERAKLFRKDPDNDLYFLHCHRDKLKRRKIPETDLNFLDQLIGALDSWLDEVEGEAKEACLPSMNSRWLTNHPVVADGEMVCATLVQQVRSYEAEWNEVFLRGDDPDAVSVPHLTKEILVNIIRRCPILESPQSATRKGYKCYSPTWLLNNVGSRFFTPRRGLMARLRHLELPRLSAIAAGITQADLGCTDEVWSHVKPKSRKTSCNLPRYFAPLPKLMRARHAITTHADPVDDDLMIALKALPPKFTVFLGDFRNKSSNLLWLQSMMITVPSQARLLKDWNLLLSSLDKYLESFKKAKDLPLRPDSLGVNHTNPTGVFFSASSDSEQEDIFSARAFYYQRQVRLRKKNTAKGRNTRTSLLRDQSLKVVTKLAEEHPELLNPMLEAFHRDCPVADASLDPIV